MKYKATESINNQKNVSARYYELTTQVLEEQKEVFQRLDMDELNSFLGVLAKYNRIFIVGAGREGIACRAFAMRLMHLGKEVHWIWDDTVPGIKVGDLFLIADGRGKIGSFYYTLEQIKKAGAHIAIITCNPEGENVRMFADSMLFVHASAYCVEREDLVSTRQPMGNQFEQQLFLLFDVLVILLKEKMGITNEQMEGRHRNWE